MSERCQGQKFRFVRALLVKMRPSVSAARGPQRLSRDVNHKWRRMRRRPARKEEARLGEERELDMKRSTIPVAGE